MKIKNWLLSIIARVPNPGSRIAQDMQVHSSKARELEPWFRHKEEKQSTISLPSRLIILGIVVVVFIIISTLVYLAAHWLLGW